MPSPPLTDPVLFDAARRRFKLLHPERVLQPNSTMRQAVEAALRGIERAHDQRLRDMESRPDFKRIAAGDAD